MLWSLLHYQPAHKAQKKDFYLTDHTNYPRKKGHSNISRVTKIIWELIKHTKTDKLGIEHISFICHAMIIYDALASNLDCRKENPAAWLLEGERCIYSSRQSLIAQWTWEQWFNCDKLEVGSKRGIKLYAFWICMHRGTTAEPVKNTKQEINFWSTGNRIKNFLSGWIRVNFNITSILKELFPLNLAKLCQVELPTSSVNGS